MTPAEGQPKSLFTREFVILNGILFFAAAIMAVFFQFQQYLGSLGINAAWFGFLIAADSLASFLLQPVLAVRLNAHNGRRWILVGILGMAALLLCYTFALDLPSLIAVRILHGAAFVCLVSAMMAMMTRYIPPKKSAQAFGFLSVVRLVPYCIVPPLLKAVDRSPADFRTILMYGSLVMVLSSAMAYQLKSFPTAGNGTSGRGQGLKMGEIARSVSNREVLALFLATLFLYSSYTIIFFFLKTHSQTVGIENPGFFFTIATAAMIGVRLLGGTFFDKISKRALTTLSMAVLAICYGLLYHHGGIIAFYVLALFTGLGWGIAMPLLMALVFDVSSPRVRSMNLNLSFVMMQGAFFFGPFFGGLLVTQWGYRALFYFCAILSLAGAVLIQTRLKRGSQ